MKDAVTPAELKELIDQDAVIRVLDVRRREHRTEVEHPIPGAEWKDPEQIADWSNDLGRAGEVIVFCVHGHNVSQGARDYLREQGVRSRIVEGGIEEWQTFVKKS